MSNDPAIIVKNLNKIFGDFTAVDNISFDIPKNCIVGLLGGNGAGKTTTLSMLMGILLPTSGSVSILDMDMPKQRTTILEQMNFSSPYIDLPSEMTIRENLTVFSHLYNVPHYKDRIHELVTEFELQDFVNRRYGKLSAGQKTRVLLAKALINTPKILLLDEPTASLDPDTADWIRTYLVNYHQKTGATILLASHNMQEVERICSSVIMMKQGTIADRGTPKELIVKYGSEDLEQVFLHIARKEVT